MALLVKFVFPAASFSGPRVVWARDEAEAVTGRCTGAAGKDPISSAYSNWAHDEARHSWEDVTGEALSKATKVPHWPLGLKSLRLEMIIALQPSIRKTFRAQELETRDDHRFAAG